MPFTNSNLNKIYDNVKIKKIPPEVNYEQALIFPWIEINIYDHLLEKEEIRFEVMHIKIKKTYNQNNNNK
jgi:hypothetical protein